MKTISKKEIENQIKLIDELRQHDHAFLGPKGVKHFSEPFGFKAKTHKAQDTRSHFKGLTLNGKKEGDVAEGLDADILACRIADHLGIEYPTFGGRGSQLRGACEAIKIALSQRLKLERA